MKLFQKLMLRLGYFKVNKVKESKDLKECVFSLSGCDVPIAITHGDNQRFVSVSGFSLCDQCLTLILLLDQQSQSIKKGDNIHVLIKAVYLSGQKFDILDCDCVVDQTTVASSVDDIILEKIIVCTVKNKVV